MQLDEVFALFGLRLVQVDGLCSKVDKSQDFSADLSEEVRSFTKNPASALLRSTPFASDNFASRMMRSTGVGKTPNAFAFNNKVLAIFSISSAESGSCSLISP